MNIKVSPHLFWPMTLLGMMLILVAPFTVAARSNGAAAAAGVVAGTYAGNVTIAEPAPLGALDLVLDLTVTGDAVAGKVNAARTQVFLGGPIVTGQVTASAGVTPTIRIESESFTGVVSGRTVQRKFVLVGVVADEANTLRGDYTETISGFTAQPLLVKGSFLLVRPEGSARIIEAPDFPTPTPTESPTPTVTGTPPTATPTATPTVTGTPPTVTPTVTGTPPTATPTGGPGGAQPSTLYLPLVGNGFAAAQGAILAEPDEAGPPEPVDTGTTPAAGAAASAEMALASSLDALAVTERAEAGAPALLLLNTDALVVNTGGGVTAIHVRVRDAIGRAVPGVTVSFAGEGGSVSPSSATTDANGAVSATFTAGATEGQATITATVNDLMRQGAVQIVKPGHNPLGHTLSASGNVTRLNPGQQANVTFTLRDGAGQPVAGELVSLFGSLGDMTPASAVTDANGQVTATFRAGNASGHAMITALAGYASASVNVQIGEVVEPDQPDEPDDPDQPDEPDQPDDPDQPDEPDGNVHRVFLPVTMR